MAPSEFLGELLNRAAAARAGEYPDRRPPGQRLGFERGLLLDRAREAGLILPAEEYRRRVEDTHGEHHVFHEPGSERYVKITHAYNGDEGSFGGGFGLTVDTLFDTGKQTQRFFGIPYVREATPFEYLLRLQLFNRTFVDRIEIEGVIDAPGQEAIVTSQPYVREGTWSQSEQVRAFMEARGFAAVPGVTAGRAESVSYYRAHDRVAVFDTHGGNFLVRERGSNIAPVDALIVSADADLAAFLLCSEEERRRELGRRANGLFGVQRTPAG